MDFRTFVVELSYFAAAVLFIVGLRRMSSERNARSGVAWAGWGMVVATVATFFWPGLATGNILLIAAAIALGALLAWYPARKVTLSDVPGMVALYTGMAGGAVGILAATGLLRREPQALSAAFMAVVGGLVGLACFSAGLIAFAKLRGWLTRPVRFKSQNQVNATVVLLAAIIGLMLLGDYPGHDEMAVTFFLLALLAGLMFMLPVAVADLPVVVSFLNALTGLAIVFVGLVVDNNAMTVIGMIVTSAGALLTALMGRTDNRPLGLALFSPPDEPPPAGET